MFKFKELKIGCLPNKNHQVPYTPLKKGWGKIVANKHVIVKLGFFSGIKSPF